eukprot:1821239-Rhodomonas_salina.3
MLCLLPRVKGGSGAHGADFSRSRSQLLFSQQSDSSLHLNETLHSVVTQGLELMILIARLSSLRHGLQGVGSGHCHSQDGRGQGERCRDAEIHREGQQDGHVQRQPVDVVDS